MLWWVGFALGAPTALSGWSLSEEAWFVEDHIVVDSPEGAVHAHDAYLFRALGPDDEVAGWVTVGDLGLSVRPEGSGGVAVLDHRLRAHGEREGAVHTWSVAASRAVLFDAARPLPSGAVPVRADRGLVVFDVERSADAEEEVLVTDLPGLPAARRQALRALLDQVDRWTQQAMDPRVGTQLDQLEGRSGQRWVAAVELAADEVRPWSGGRWLSWTHDPTGIMAPGRAAVFRGADHRVLAQQRATTGVVVERIGGGWQLRTAPRFHGALTALHGGTPRKLSKAAMEVLAAIAYEQPCTRTDVEALRGVDSGGVLKSLLERGLVRVAGRSSVPGRPLLYRTTREFLELFSLPDLGSLPTVADRRELTTAAAGQEVPLLHDDADPEGGGPQGEE